MRACGACVENGRSRAGEIFFLADGFVRTPPAYTRPTGLRLVATGYSSQLYSGFSGH